MGRVNCSAIAESCVTGAATGTQTATLQCPEQIRLCCFHGGISCHDETSQSVYGQRTSCRCEEKCGWGIENERWWRWKFKRGPLTGQRLPVQTFWVSIGVRTPSPNTTHRVRSHARHYLIQMSTLASCWQLRLPKVSGEDAGTLLSSNGLLVLYSPDSAPARFLDQRLYAASSHQQLACTCTAVVSLLCRIIARPGGDHAFMHLSP
jgi:hypothetical protein